MTRIDHYTPGIIMTQDLIKNEELAKVQAHLGQLQTGCLELLARLEKTGDADAMADADLEESDILAQLRRKMIADVVELRSMNWSVQEQVNATKDVTLAEKLSVDRIQLDIQNIYYQHMHLRSEIDACDGFRSRHENLGLVDLDQFYADNPELKDTITDEHTLMMERLRDEERRRLELHITRTRLAEKKAQLLEENRQRKEDLEALDANLSKFIESAEPIRQVFGKY